MKAITYKVGMLVEHPRRPEWGPGKVVAVGDDRVYVYFRNDLARKPKTMLTSVLPLEVAASQNDEILDTLPAATHDGLDWMLPRNYEKLMQRAGAAK